MNLRQLSAAELEGLVTAASAELAQRRRPPEDVRLLLQAALVLEGYAWKEVFPDVPEPHTSAETEDANPVAPTGSRPLTQLLSVLGERGGVDVAVNLREIQNGIGLSDDWAGFFAVIEEAVRRNWVRFRGRDHASLTDEGRRALVHAVGLGGAAPSMDRMRNPAS